MTQGQTAPGPRTAVPAAVQHFDAYDIAMDAHEFEMLVRRLDMVQRTQASELERAKEGNITRHELLQVWTYLSGLNASLLVELEAMRVRHYSRMRLTIAAMDEYHDRHNQDLDATT